MLLLIADNINVTFQNTNLDFKKFEPENPKGGNLVFKNYLETN